VKGESKLERKAVSGIMLTLLLIGMLTLAFNIQPVKAWTGTVYIRADGSIDPPDAPIITYDNVTYTLTDNITTSANGIIVERDNIVIDGAGYTVKGTGIGRGIELSYVNNVTVRDMEIRVFLYGIELFRSSNNVISTNNLTYNDHGIGFFRSSHNIITANNIANNRYMGITIYEGADNNTITANSIATHSYDGIYVEADGNTITANNIANNRHSGVYFAWASNNKLYHNNFINNKIQAVSYGLNIWDDGYPSGGNYWSDYGERYPDAKELDDSGIWDTPYVIDENNQDNYPLMEPWTPKPPSPLEALDELTQTVESYNLDTGIETSLTSKLQVAYHSLDRGNHNASTGQLTAFINQVEALRDKKLTNEQADQLTSEAQRIIDLIKG
jgi:parallel beta-helix repeat protein